MNGLRIGGSSLLTVLGVLCAVAIFVAAATLISNQLAINDVPVYDNEIALAQGTPTSNDWSDAGAHYVNDTYTETIIATFNGYTGQYYMSMTAPSGYNVQATCNGATKNMTYSESAWISDTVTADGDNDTWVFTFTPNQASSDVDITFEAYSP